MFLSNTANTVQALDAKTGELIWENRIGPAPTRAYGATRSLAIYGDKIIHCPPPTPSFMAWMPRREKLFGRR